MTTAAWEEAVGVAALFAVDPVGTGGVLLRSRAGPLRERWLGFLEQLLPPSAPRRRVPLNVADSRLLGGLDLAATLTAGRAVVERGILADSDGGVAIVANAERMDCATAARVARVLDDGTVALERDGIARRWRARFGVVALDERASDEEGLPAVLRERLAFTVDLDRVAAPLAACEACPDQGAVGRARALLPGVEADAAAVRALCAAAIALGIDSLRAPLLALRAARAAAALDGRGRVRAEDLAIAARAVLAPLATCAPETAPGEAQGEAPEDAAGRTPEPARADAASGSSSPRAEGAPDSAVEAGAEDLERIVVDAARTVLPAGLLAGIGDATGGARRPSPASGRAGALAQTRLRGRPAGVRRGDPRCGLRLALIDTLRAAAPWQLARRRVSAPAARSGRPRVEVRREDFRVHRLMARRTTTTIFVVDASGSSAVHRLAEAKGAVELLLAECYARRDRVALIAFGGREAALLLPPTRSLVRARRSLVALPGGGGTPLAAAIDAATALAQSVRRTRDSALVVLLTDARANVARDGRLGRAAGEADALAAAPKLAAVGVRSLVVDTSAFPQPGAERLAARMAARYLPLPFADARALSHALRAQHRAAAGGQAA